MIILTTLLCVVLSFLGPSIIGKETKEEPCTITYSEWSPCSVVGVQTREFTIYPSNCEIVPPLDSIERACKPAIEVSKFYYDVEKHSILICCNVSGTLTVIQAEDNSEWIFQYRAGQSRVGIQQLPKGKYYALTYGRSFLFLK